MGHLKADCIKNAAKSLGASFGANILRDIENGELNAEFMDPSVVEADLLFINDKKTLVSYFKGLPKIVAGDKRVKNALKRRQIQLENQPNQ